MAGGFSKVLARARRVGCETMQLFTRSPRSWAARELDPDDVAAFRRDLDGSGISPVFVHASYLPNLAAAPGPQADRAVDVLAEEMRRCAALGAGFLIVHAGRAGEQSREAAVRSAARNADRVLHRVPRGPLLLLENTAGMGSEVGNRFEQLADTVAFIERRDRVGVVLDTAHLFEAGYELRTRSGLDSTLRDFDGSVGLGRLHLLHLNDSRTDYGSRVDRHWHIGKGRIGVEGFRLIVNHPLLSHLPAILETPRRTHRDDLANLRVVKGLLG